MVVAVGVLTAAPDDRTPEKEDSPVLPASAHLSTTMPRHTKKLRKWTGNLVDVVCMQSALRQIPSPNQLANPLSQYFDVLEKTQRDQQEHTSPVGSAPPNRAESSLDRDGEPQSSEREIAAQEAQLWRMKMLEEAATACTPRNPTKHFGLWIAEGKLLKFDDAGNLKSKEIVDTSRLEPGQKVKVRVTGAIEEADTISVASIEIKQRIPTSRVGQGVEPEAREPARVTASGFFVERDPARSLE